MQFVVYLAGEIHSNWRDEIKNKAKAAPADYICWPDGKPRALRQYRRRDYGRAA